MTFDMETTQKFVCRANIVKYEKMLATYLTSIERHYVEVRLSEEQAALRQLNRSVLDKQLRPFMHARRHICDFEGAFQAGKQVDHNQLFPRHKD